MNLAIICKFRGWIAPLYSHFNKIIAYKNKQIKYIYKSEYYKPTNIEDETISKNY